MNAASQPTAPSKQLDGDEVFLGVDQRDARSLTPGLLNDARNLRFTDFVPQTRKGVVKPGWANRVDALTRETILPWGTVYGAGTFRDPDSRAWGLLAADGGAYRLLPYNQAVSMALPAGVKILGPCTFCQAFDKVYCFRGQFLAPLRMADFDTGFEDIVPHWNASDTWTTDQEVAFGPFQDVTSITRVGNTATVTTAAPHGYITGADITHQGAGETEYNVRANITVIDPLTYTFAFAGSATSPATGTITCSNMIQYWKANGSLLAGNNPDDNASDWTRVWNILPNADNALYINNRMLVPTAYEPSSADNYATFNGGSYKKKDYIVATDYLDDIHFDFSNEFRINQGSADAIVDLAKFNESTVVIWKDASWAVLSNVAFALTDLSLDFRNTEYGLAARGAWTMAGADLYFTATKRGVVSVRQSENGKLIGVDLPLSAPIQKLIDRIQWTEGAGIRLANWDSKLYCAVPISENTVTQNTLLVYDLVAAARGGANDALFNNFGWCGRDTGTAICPIEFFKMPLDGSDRLFFAAADGFVNLMEESDAGDQVASGDTDNALDWEEIETYALTRAYLKTDTRLSKPTTGTLVVQTWNPSYSANMIFSGVNRKTVLATDKTRSNTKYFRPWDAADWDPTNANDDHDAADREDYRVVLGSTGLHLGSGVQLDRFQEAIHNLRLNGRQGRSFQVELTNTTGRVKLLAVVIDAAPGRERKGLLT